MPPHESLALAAILFAFWVILSGKLDAFHLGAGALFSLGIAVGSCRLYGLDPPIVWPGRHPFAAMPWLRLLAYLPWLAGEIFLSSFQVARIVLSPRMPIQPGLFSFHKPLPHALARATLANSITLTPGTVTIDVTGDEYLVHALTESSARSLLSDAPGSMKERVGALFPSSGSRTG